MADEPSGPILSNARSGGGWQQVATIIGAIFVVLSQIIEVIELIKIDRDTTELISVVQQAKELIPKK